MKKLFAIALAAATCALAAGAADARTDVSWSIGINLPPVGAVVSNGPVYAPAPVYYEPAPVYYEPAAVYPAPVYLLPPRVRVRPVPVVVYPRRHWAPAPVVYGGYGGYGYGYGPRHWHGGWQPVPADPRRYPH
jgi:hypothetical protein